MKKSSVAFLALLMAGMSACYGPFNLTRKIYKWNGSVSDKKWVREGTFLGLAIFPVYFFATLGDAIIFNSIEFWGGKNPVTAKNTRSLDLGNEQAVLNYDPASKRLRIDGFEKGHAVSTLVVAPEGQAMVARDAQGRLIASAKTVDGQVVVSDAAGRTITPQLR